MIASYLNDAFQIKAMITAMPKFGSDVKDVLKGIGKMLLIMSLKYEEAHAYWFQSVLKPNMDSFKQIVNSSYLSPEVIDSKVQYLSIVMEIIYTYSSDKQKQILKQDFLPVISVVLDRFENALLLPLTKYDLIGDNPSEKSKIQSLFSQLKSYTSFIQLAIKIIHIHSNQSNSALEKTIKLVLEQTLKLTSD